MSEHTDLTKIREWTEDDGSDPDEWPAAPEYTEYRVEGQMRSDVLRKLGRSGDECEVRLIEGVIEGGYSEWTVEHDYPIEAWIHEGRQRQRVFEDTTYWQEDSLAAFLRWITPATDEAAGADGRA